MDQLTQAGHSTPINLAHISVSDKREQQTDETQTQPDIGFVDVNSDRVRPSEVPQAPEQDVDPLMLPGTRESQSPLEPNHFKQEVLDSIKQEPPETLVCPTTSSEPQNTDQDVDSLQLSSPPESWCFKQEEFHVKDEPPMSQSCLMDASEVCSAELQADTGLSSTSTKCITGPNSSSENHSRTECDTMFASPDHVKKHSTGNICNQGDEQTISGRHQPVCSEEQVYACDICEAKFNDSHSRTKHKRTHSDLRIRPYTCDTCEAKFILKSHLITHKRTHSGEKPFACDICEARFPHQSTVTTHKRTHSGEKPFACDQCDARFSVNGRLVTHKRTHTGEKPYACDVCKARFSISGSLTKHKRIHSGEKPFACDVCEARFAVSGGLVTHKRTHTKLKPYACDICDARFTHSSTVTRHKRTHSGRKAVCV